ncbi:MAG: heavy metal translocating P-type ATPase, partial [Alphaproteobacteria bacterium]|nr:heavy metal translocating P-type ATPase [Alphaproteobacteria bacterium]
GMLNRDAPLAVRITAAGKDRTIEKLSRIMSDAAQYKARYVRIADRAARWYAPAVHVTAALSFAGWVIAGVGWHEALRIAIAVLIITCPCALGLAVPVAQFVATGRLMKAGILVKDGSALERLAKIDYVLFDKTGTLTLGVPKPENLNELKAETAQVVLALAQMSMHPLSKALAQGLVAQGITPATLTNISETRGYGIRGERAGHIIELARPKSRESVTAVDVLLDGAPISHIRFSDRLRMDAVSTIERLGKMGLECSILSGDTRSAVVKVAEKLNLKAQAEASPADKIDAIKVLHYNGHKVLMVGDGLNDGPALATAYASMVPSSATDVGQQAADLVFMGEGLSAIPEALFMARHTRRVIQQNFALAIGYNILAVPLAITGYVTPLIAAIAMSASSIIVVANAMRLLRVKT